MSDESKIPSRQELNAVAPEPAAATVAAAEVKPVKEKPLSDWVNVRLTDAGIAFAGEGARVHVANGRMSYTFVGPVAQRVLRKGEATLLLAETAGGQPMFELLPDAPAAT